MSIAQSLIRSIAHVQIAQAQSFTFKSLKLKLNSSRSMLSAQMLKLHPIVHVPLLSAHIMSLRPKMKPKKWNVLWLSF